MNLSDVLTSIIIEANPTIPPAKVKDLLRKYEKVAKCAD